MILLKSLRTIFLRLPWSVTLLCIVILAFCLRLGVWYCDPVISRDGISYILLAETLRKSDGNFEVLAQMRGEYRQSPFFISILASDIFGASPHLIALTMNIVLGSLFSVVIYMIFMQLSKKSTIALTGALFVAVHPTLINYSIEVQREMGYLFFSGCCFFFLFGEWGGRPWYWSAVTAVTAVLAFFFRYEGLELFIFCGIIYLILLKQNFKWKEWGRGVVFVLSVILAIVMILLSCQKSPAKWFKNSLDKITYRIR